MKFPTDVMGHSWARHPKATRRTMTDPRGLLHHQLLTKGDLWGGTTLRPTHAGQPTKVHYPADLMGCPGRHQPTTRQEVTPRNPPGTLPTCLPTEGNRWIEMGPKSLIAEQPPKTQ